MPFKDIDIAFSTQEVHTGLNRAWEAYDPRAGRTTKKRQEVERLTRSVAERIERTDDAAVFFVPATRFALDSVLAVMHLPSVRRRLPREVSERYTAASRCAYRVTQAGLERDLFDQLYLENKDLRNIGYEPDDIASMLRKEHYLPSIVAAPFYDTCVIGGGAGRALLAGGVKEGVSDIVAKSKGLLAGAYTAEEHADQIHQHFGSPYAPIAYYEIDRGEPSIDFTAEIRTWLNGLRMPDQGCPALRLASPDDQPQSLIQTDWQRLVHYLMPREATIDGQPIESMA